MQRIGALIAEGFVGWFLLFLSLCYAVLPVYLLWWLSRFGAAQERRHLSLMFELKMWRMNGGR